MSNYHPPGLTRGTDTYPGLQNDTDLKRNGWKQRLRFIVPVSPYVGFVVSLSFEVLTLPRIMKHQLHKMTAELRGGGMYQALSREGLTQNPTPPPPLLHPSSHRHPPHPHLLPPHHPFPSHPTLRNGKQENQMPPTLGKRALLTVTFHSVSSTHKNPESLESWHLSHAPAPWHSVKAFHPHTIQCYCGETVGCLHLPINVKGQLYFTTPRASNSTSWDSREPTSR